MKERNVYIVELPNGKPVKVTDHRNRDRETRALKFTQNGQALLYSTSTDERIHSLEEMEKKNPEADYVVPDDNFYLLSLNDGGRRHVGRVEGYPMVSLAPDGQNAAFLTCDDSDCTNDINVRDLDGRTVIATSSENSLPPTVHRPFAWANDSKTIFVFEIAPSDGASRTPSHSCQLVQCLISTGERKVLAQNLWPSPTFDGEVRDMAVTPSGFLVAAGNTINGDGIQDNSILLYDLNTGKSLRIPCDDHTIQQIWISSGGMIYGLTVGEVYRIYPESRRIERLCAIDEGGDLVRFGGVARIEGHEKVIYDSRPTTSSFWEPIASDIIMLDAATGEKRKLFEKTDGFSLQAVWSP
ncbi:hypothetical protein HYR69_01440 [Candidatus Sumerlaeota bacterium]|nr:hypothetical protein [Candidatus Sumerlaeota bacterium]